MLQGPRRRPFIGNLGSIFKLGIHRVWGPWNSKFGYVYKVGPRWLLPRHCMPFLCVPETMISHAQTSKVTCSQPLCGVLAVAHRCGGGATPCVVVSEPQAAR